MDIRLTFFQVGDPGRAVTGDTVTSHGKFESHFRARAAGGLLAAACHDSSAGQPRPEALR